METNFKCFGPSGENLCLNGVCSNSSTLLFQTCVCDPGWSRDYILYHSEGCALPSIVPLILMILGFALFLLSLLFALKRLRQSRAMVRNCLLYGVLYNLFCGLQNLGVYVQGGWFEFSSVSNAFSTMFLVIWADQLVGIIVIPLLQLERRKDKDIVRPRIRQVLTCLAVVLLSVSLGELITCRDPKPYNNVIDSMLILSSIISLGAAYVFYRLSRRLVAQMRPLVVTLERDSVKQSGGAHNATESTEELLGRIGTIQSRVVTQLVGSIFSLLPWFVINTLLGSAPYSGLFFYTMLFTQQLAITGVNMKLFRNTKDWKKSKHGSSPTNKASKQLEDTASKAANTRVIGNTGVASAVVHVSSQD